MRRNCVCIFLLGLLLAFMNAENVEEDYKNDEEDLDNDLDLNYCEPDLCRIFNGTDFNYLDHIACNNNGTFDDKCKDASMMIMDPSKINMILDLHNAKRNQIALGQLPGYNSASNMTVLKWDTELQYLASLNVKRCRFQHDDCRNTAKFSHSGQNLAWFWNSKPIKNETKLIAVAIDGWFDEYKDANQTFIDEYQPHPENKVIGHFTMLVSDGAHRVGCAASRYKDENNNFTLLLACNYDYTNIMRKAIYKSGSPATECSHEVSLEFPGLCEWDNETAECSETFEYDDYILSQ